MNNFYGFLTKKGKNIFLITLLSTALLFASCINDLFENDKSSKKQEAQTEHTGSEELIPVKINISNKKQIENILQNVKLQKNISQARTASPQNVGLKYKILYKRVTDASQSSCELTDSSAVLPLSMGIWDFTLVAYYNDSSDNEMVVFSGDILNKEITPGNNSLEFTLKEPDSGKGNISIILKIPALNDYAIVVKTQLKDYPSLDAVSGYEESEFTINSKGYGNPYVYSLNNVPHGNYFVVFSIKTTYLNDSTLPETTETSETTVYPVPVRVVTNLTSDSIEKLTDIRNVCVITYDLGTDGTVSWTADAKPVRVSKKYQNVDLPDYTSLNPLQTKIFNGWKVQGGTEVISTMIIEQNVTLEPDWITTTLYVDGSATEAEHDALKESTAVKTLQDAVTKLADYEALDGNTSDYQHEWVINVKGTCYGTSDLSSLGITKLKITGDNNAQDILDGSTGTGAVITKAPQNEGTYPLYIKNLTIQNGSNSAGGGLNITNTTAYLDTIVLIDNKASDNGGAIALTNSKLFIYGGTKIGPESPEAVAESTKCSNRAGVSGGGIYADENSTIYFGYTATDEDAGTMTAEEGTPANAITYNYAGGPSESTYGGGGIYCLGKLYINGGTISYNRAARKGGGIYTKSLSMKGSTVSNNAATYEGGAIYLEATQTTKSFITSADFNGTTTSTEISGNTSENPSDNTPNSHGGGIAFYGGELYISDTIISGNKASSKGGGIYVNKWSSYQDAKLFLYGTTKIGVAPEEPSFATSGSNSNSATCGGGIYLETSTKAYLNYSSEDATNHTGTVNITYNYADKDNNNNGGGGIFADSNSELYIAPGTTINYNAGARGAGIFGKGTTYMSGGTIYGNNALYGGGICLSGRDYTDYNLDLIHYGTLYMYGDAKIGTSENPNSALYGGGIYLANCYSQAYLGDGENNLSGGVSYNKAFTTTYGGPGVGGGIYNKGLLQVSSGNISNNISETDGGGIYNSGTLEISAATIKSNTADGSGGGIYTTNLSMKGSTVSNNAATGEGGGIFINSSSTTKSSITSVEFNGITTSTKISGNTSSSNGGGISFTDGELYISGTTICDNKATSNGGGIYVGSGTSARLFLFGATTIGAASASSFATEDYKSNSAENGGGIFINSNASAYINFSSETDTDHTGTVNITYNYAKIGDPAYGGGGIYAEMNSKLYIAPGTTINYNEGAKGGGIYGKESTIYMSGGTIYGNDAQYGGGICLTGTDIYKGTLYMYGEAKIGTSENLIYDSDSAIYYSNGAVYGGGIYIDDHSQAYLGYSGIDEENKTLTGGVYFNCAFKIPTSGSGTGGGVYNKGIFHVSSGNIKSNTATSNGGGIYTTSETSTNETVLEDSEITENTAVNGGGVYIAAGHLDIKRATIFKENIATGKGGAIGGEIAYYINIEEQGELAYAYIEPNSACNDIYLNSLSSINLNLRGNTLSPDHDYIARFTPYEYVDNVTYIGGGDYDSYKKFKVTPQKLPDTTEVEWVTTSNGKIQEKP